VCYYRCDSCILYKRLTLADLQYVSSGIRESVSIGWWFYDRYSPIMLMYKDICIMGKRFNTWLRFIEMHIADLQYVSSGIRESVSIKWWFYDRYSPIMLMYKDICIMGKRFIEMHA